MKIDHGIDCPCDDCLFELIDSIDKSFRKLSESINEIERITGTFNSRVIKPEMILVNKGLRVLKGGKSE